MSTHQNNFYSIHTFTVYIDFSMKYYHSLKNTLHANAEKIYPRFGTYYATLKCFPGIRIALGVIDYTCSYGTPSSQGILQLVINPEIIVRHMEKLSYNYYDIFEPTVESCMKVESYVDRVCHDLGLHKLTDKRGNAFDLVPDGFESFAIDNIDYCVNHYFSSHDEVIMYLELAKRGFVPSYMEEEDIPYIKSGKGQPLKYKSKSMHIFLYDKTMQLDSCYPVHADNNKHTLRFEIRVRSEKLKRMANTHLSKKKPSNFEWLMTCRKLCYKQMQYFIPLLFKSGRYIPRNYICCILNQHLEQGELTPEYMAIMRDFMYSVAKHKSLEYALREFEHHHNVGQLQYLKRRFKDLNLNPVSIPERLLRGSELRYQTQYPSITDLLGLDIPFPEKVSSIAC